MEPLNFPASVNLIITEEDSEVLNKLGLEDNKIPLILDIENGHNEVWIMQLDASSEIRYHTYDIPLVNPVPRLMYSINNNFSDNFVDEEAMESFQSLVEDMGYSLQGYEEKRAEFYLDWVLIKF